MKDTITIFYSLAQQKLSFFCAVVYGNIPNFKILEISKHITMIISYRREKDFFIFLFYSITIIYLKIIFIQIITLNMNKNDAP